MTAAYLKLLTRAAEIDAGGAARRLVVASLVSLYPFGTVVSYLSLSFSLFLLVLFPTALKLLLLLLFFSLSLKFEYNSSKNN